MTDRRAGRAGGLVEVDHALLGRHETGERRHQLRHRGEPVDACAVTERAELPVRAEDGDGHVLDVPPVDLTQGVHAVILGAWSGALFLLSRRWRRPSATRAPSAPAAWSRSPGRRRSCRTAAILPPTRTARPSAA